MQPVRGDDKAARFKRCMTDTNPVLAYNTTFGTEWLRPTDVLQGRMVKIGGQLSF